MDIKFTINLAKGKSVPLKLKAPSTNRISRLCIGTCIKENDEYKIRIFLGYKDAGEEFLILPFTENSLDLRGKQIIFLKKKDKTNHYVAIYRNNDNSGKIPPKFTQYTTVVEGEICSGYIVSEQGKHLFQLKGVHGRGERRHDMPTINEKQPLFLKDGTDNSK